MKIWTRQEIVKKLKDWSEDIISAEEIWEWASEEWTPYADEYVDGEYDENGVFQSVSRDVVNYLEELARLDIVKGDIPLFLEYLNTPPGEYVEGRRKLDKYFDLVDWDVRNQNLKQQKPYSYWERRN